MEKRKLVAIRISIDDIKKLKEVSKLVDLNMSQLIRRGIKIVLDNNKEVV